MTSLHRTSRLVAAVAATILSAPAWAHDIASPAAPDLAGPLDILSARARVGANDLRFEMTVRGEAGAERPAATGQLPGAPVLAYVWPTSLDASAAGFAPGAGILALAVTAHPDFDDTPLFDENGDGDPANDGADWHSHWVVLVETGECGDVGLKVADIAPGQAIERPPTAPPLPLLLDSPGYSPLFSGDALAIRVPLVNGADEAGFDAVTASLAVNDAGAAPLLCVTEVHDVASGDLSLSGRVEAEE